MIDQLGEEVMAAQAHSGKIVESKGVEGEDRRMDGGEVEIHRFEILVGGDDVKDPIQGEVGCR